MSPLFTASPDAPVAEKRPTTQEVHGITLPDDYAWLRAENWQAAMRDPSVLPAEIAAYLEAENAYYTQAMADTEALQATLVAEMRGRIAEDDDSVPRPHGPYLYHRRYVAGGEYPIYVRKPRADGDEEVILDVNHEAEGHSYFQMGGSRVCPDHATLAWSADTNGSEFRALRFRDLASGAQTGHVIEDVGSFAWADPATLFYVKVDAQHRPNKLYRHRLGSDPAEDALVYEETDERFYVAIDRSRSGAFMILMAGMNDESEVWLIPTDAPDTAPLVVEPRRTGIEYHVEHQGDQLIILTNDEAEDFRVVTAPLADPGRANWQDLLPSKPGVMRVGHAAYRDWLIWVERENALPSICYLRRGAPFSAVQRIAFPEAAYALGIDPADDHDSDVLRFVYSSPTTPQQVFDFNLSTGARDLRKETEIPSGHDPSAYVTQRVLAPSHDGAEVPVTLLYRADTPLDGTAPCLLYGYGSYGMSMPAAFSANRLSLVDRGFVHAVAHVRGGEEKGRAWYEAAKFGRKPNTFHDTIAVAETLSAKQVVARDKIVVMGGSAGGLLVGAVVNMRPDLFAGAIADVPFVDMLNTILDASLPLTPGEWSQWGNPIESRAAFDDIRSYSPYDNVTAQAYPAMLVTAGVSDPRVTYWEPAKWVAKLRATKTDDAILMLRTNMSSGHFGKSGRFAALEDAARSFAFAIKACGARG
ncbi:MAG: S9 family peptidase [Pseudomonadota bacterium]